MALSSSIVSEVRTTGADTNGGGFKTGATGTDWSQQDSPQYSVTDGVTAGTTTITSATANFGTDVVGNLIYVSGGTGSVAAGWYEIISRTNSTTIVVDRSTGLTAGTGVTLKIGGALATPATGLSILVAGNIMYIKGGTYTISSALTPPTLSGDFVTSTRVIGYSSTRGDAGRPIIQATAGITLWDNTVASHLMLENIDFDGNNVSNTTGVHQGGTAPGTFNCIIRRITGRGFLGDGAYFNTIIGCEVTGCGGTNGSIEMTAVFLCADCYVHDNTSTGIYAGVVGGTILNNICDTNTGASSDGIFCAYTGVVSGNTCYNNGRRGIYRPSYNLLSSTTNNILVNNGTYGIYGDGAGLGSAVQTDFNFFYNNTSGPRSGFVAGEHDVLLSGDPFTDAANGDFSLNNTSGAGASVRATASPNLTVSGLVARSYRDGGALQHQDSGGGGESSSVFG